MILYSYRCDNCSKEFRELRSVEDRHSCPCPNCEGVTAKQIITAPRIDYLGMGVSLSFPTAADKWAKMHERGAQSQDRE